MSAFSLPKEYEDRGSGNTTMKERLHGIDMLFRLRQSWQKTGISQETFFERITQSRQAGPPVGLIV